MDDGLAESRINGTTGIEDTILSLPHPSTADGGGHS